MFRRLRYVQSAVLAGGVLAVALLGGGPASASFSAPLVVAPTLDSVTVSGTTATLKWTDRSTNEGFFDIDRRDAATTGLLGTANTVHTTNSAGTGDVYTQTVTVTGRTCFTIYAWKSGPGDAFSNEVCTTALPAVTPPTPLALGMATSVDTAGLTGIEPSSAIGKDGLGIAAYALTGNSTSGRGLRVSHCNDADCSAATTTSIDTTGNLGLGDGASIKIGGDGLPLISYRAPRSLNGPSSLKVAHCANVACTSTTSAVIVDSLSSVGETSMAIGGDGFGLISFEDFNSGGTSGIIKVVHCLDALCTTSKSSVIDSAIGTSGAGSPAVAIGPTGLGVIAYHDTQSNSLKVAACLSADCSLPITTPISVTNYGTDPAITIGRDGLPLISFNDPAGGLADLFVAHCLNVFCTQVGVSTVDTGNVGSRSSITIGGDGLGVISHYDLSNQNLKVTHCSNLACSTATTVNVDEFGDVGAQSSMVTGQDGFPLISYLDRDNEDLKVAHCPDSRCAGGLVVPF